MASNEKEDVSVRQLKSLVKFMRENGVAEFSVGETTVKFAFQRHAPTPEESVEASEKFSEFKNNLTTHLDGRSHAQKEQDENQDLFWST
jgi:hypothetical protein